MKPSGLRRGLQLGAFVLLAPLGALLLTDQVGLRAEYFALATPWRGDPFGTAVSVPEIDGFSQVAQHLETPVVFSVRWRGWWRVAQEGEHQFILSADDGGYLRIDGRPIVETAAGEGERPVSARAVLTPGFHEIEVGYFQNSGNARLVVLASPPGVGTEAARPLPSADLYAARPLALRRLLRGLPTPGASIHRQLLGALLLLTGLVLLVPACGTRWPAAISVLRRRLRSTAHVRLRVALLLTLFVTVFVAVFPYTGTVVGGDDTSYLDTATFNVKTWYVHRYAHVYLLKLFTALSGGDPLLGVRAWWSFVMAATVAALAVAVRSVGPGLQLRTLAATLFVLAAQPTVWGLVGAGFADYSAMMFVTVATAVFLHGAAHDRQRPASRHEWHALSIGALTIGAAKSKEVGAVLLALLPLLVLPLRTAPDWRRAARKAASWCVGAAGAYALLLGLDGWILGDVAFTWGRERLQVLREMNFPSTVPERKSDWLELIWGSRELRTLWIGVVAAAVVAGVRRREIQLRLLHLLPIAYLLGLIVLYVRLPHPISSRMLIPILPSACLMTGLLLHYAGLDELPWRRWTRPAALIAGGMAAALVFLVLIPLQRGALRPSDLLPIDRLRRYGWEPEHFMVGVALPIAVLTAFGVAALAATRRSRRLAALLLAYVVLFGAGFEVSRTSLARETAAQTGALLLYPWRSFREELATLPGVSVVLSADLRSYFRMTGATKSSLAKLALRRPDVHVSVARNYPAEAQVAIASRNAYLNWLREVPSLAESARFDPSGFLVLVRPKEAAESPPRSPIDARSQPATPAIVESRLEDLRASREPGPWRELLRWLLDNPSGTRPSRVDDLLSLSGTQLRAVGIYPDGWTNGARPAGLVVDNRTSTALAQSLVLVVGDSSRPLPTQVFIDDGDRIVTVPFARETSRAVDLSPVPPFSSRLFLVWAEAAWTPSGADPRQLGVRIVAGDRP